jgi:hypothetical protein
MTDVSALPIRHCRFRFKCHARWGDLAPTAEETVRYCHECGKEVFLCTNGRELAEAIQQQRCVAVDIAPITPADLTFLPHPEEPVQLMTRLIGEVG